MQLYVLGPAFGLPSIDPECIAAAALLRLYLTQEWHLIPTHEQTRHLPCLIHGATWYEGYKNISRYVEQMGAAQDEKRRADSIAITSFLESQAQTLLDISLYVSYENYATTRHAFTKIMPWYANYIIPPKRRAAARKRTEHLGILSIDVDDVHEDLSNRPPGFDVGKEPTFEAETQKRASMLLPRKDTVRSLLRRPEHSAIFKLHTIADNFFGPLQDMLGENHYILGTEGMQTVDCLAYGYLSLMLYPKLPQDWLAKTMHRKYAKLVQYTERMHLQLEMQTSQEEVMFLARCKNEGEIDALRQACNMTLPWEPIAKPSLGAIVTTIAQDLASRIPFIGSSAELVPATAQELTFWQTYFPAMVAVTATSIGLFGYYAATTGLWVWPHGEKVHIFGRKRLADYGHLGAALAGMSILGQQASPRASFHPQDMSDNPVRVEVELEKDGVP